MNEDAFSISLYDWLGSEDAALLGEDVTAWADWYPGPQPGGMRDEFMRLFNSGLSEFRSLFDYRAAHSRQGQSFSGLARDRLPRANDLYLRTPSLGPRCRIQHGHGTWLLARSVGADFWINQNVTVGATASGDPVIGDRVTILTGAVVVGGIHVGHDTIITANAVVSGDVPANSRVYAARSVIVQREP